MKIDEHLVRRLIATQFPQWKDLPVWPVTISGWDNRTFHLGNHLVVRMPSAAHYAGQVEKEHRWLPKLAPLLPLRIPEPLVMGEPGEGYPWKWSIYRWIEGDSATSVNIADLKDFSIGLAQFLTALHSIDPTGGPSPGPHNLYRGGSLMTYDEETRRAITILKDRIDFKTAIEIWETALATIWTKKPVWIHGDMSAGNLLVQNRRLYAVIDFGQLGIGDPACDLAIAWTMFHDESRELFQSMLQLDPNTWTRGRAWTLWKALIVAAGFTNPNNLESSQCWLTITEILADHKKKT